MARVRQTVVLEVECEQPGTKDPADWNWMKIYEDAAKHTSWVDPETIEITVMHGGPVTEVEGG